MGQALGIQTVEEAHQAPGQLHRAFSVVLTDDSGRILLQRRSAAKTRFASLWANACCGHPAPGQSIGTSANRRLHEELGLEPISLTDAGVYVYYAEDPIAGRVEFEYDLRWVNRRELKISLDANPKNYAPWLVGVIARLAEHESTTDPAKPAEPSGGR
jgi:isopentenyl-diphosphate Delta-isomerase